MLLANDTDSSPLFPLSPLLGPPEPGFVKDTAAPAAAPLAPGLANCI